MADKEKQTKQDNLEKEENLLPNFNKSSAATFGGIEIVLGIASIVLGVEAYLVYMPLGYVGYGVWCGLIYIIVGAVGLNVASKPSQSSLLGLLVGLFFGVLFTIAEMMLAGWSLYYCIWLPDPCYSSCSAESPYCSKWSHEDVCIDSGNLETSRFSSLLLMIIGSATFFCMMSSAALCIVGKKTNKVAPASTYDQKKKKEGQKVAPVTKVSPVSLLRTAERDTQTTPMPRAPANEAQIQQGSTAPTAPYHFLQSNGVQLVQTQIIIPPLYVSIPGQPDIRARNRTIQTQEIQKQESSAVDKRDVYVQLEEDRKMMVSRSINEELVTPNTGSQKQAGNTRPWSPKYVRTPTAELEEQDKQMMALVYNPTNPESV